MATVQRDLREQLALFVPCAADRIRHVSGGAKFRIRRFHRFAERAQRMIRLTGSPQEALDAINALDLIHQREVTSEQPTENLRRFPANLSRRLSWKHEYNFHQRR
jgi:hypothetical protein